MYCKLSEANLQILLFFFNWTLKLFRGGGKYNLTAVGDKF